jgi:ABC-type multidrug transport system ATPase subunit
VADLLADTDVTARAGGSRTTLRADRAGLAVDGRWILKGASLEVSTGELVGLIGPSGSGKTTLVRVLAGVAEPTEGEITLDGAPVGTRSVEVGYLPYVDTVHDRLTVREELSYAAALRMPEDTPAELRARVDAVLAELGLEDQADQSIASLSGGERRRAACAVEMLAHPSVLLLDEPATGLDPQLERRLMVTLRALADQGRGVLVTTHATSSLAVCDSVAVMGPGGRMRFHGPPAEALEFFGVSSYDEIYDRLEEAHEPEHEDHGVIAPTPARRRRVRGVGPFLPQVSVLAERYWRTLSRDRRTFALLLAQAPIIGLAIGFVLPRDVLSDGRLGAFYSLLLCFLLVTASVWLGVFSSCREVVKERAATAREVAAGVRFDAYLASKLAVLLPLTAVQAGLLFGVVVLAQPLHESAAVHVQMLGICVLSAWAAVTLGLLVSALSRSADQATSAVPLLLIPQLLLAGAIIPTASMPGAMEALSHLAISRWGLTGLGEAMGIGGELGSLASVTGFDPGFFSIGAGGAAAVLLGFSAVTLAATGVALDRRAVN